MAQLDPGPGLPRPRTETAGTHASRAGAKMVRAPFRSLLRNSHTSILADRVRDLISQLHSSERTSHRLHSTVPYPTVPEYLVCRFN